MATECPAPPGSSETLARFDSSERLEFIRRGLDVSARKARRWTWAWSAVFAGTLVAELGLMPWIFTTHREDYFLSAGGTALGLAALLAMPPSVMQHQRELEARLRDAARRGGEHCRVLAEAERYLDLDADSERRGRGALVHITTVSLNLAVGIAIAFAFHHYTNAAIGAGIGIAVGELAIWTQPTASMRLRDQYRSGDLRSSSAAVRGWTVRPLVAPSHVGLAFGASF